MIRIGHFAHQGPMGANSAEFWCLTEDWFTNTAHFLPRSTELPRYLFDLLR
jgi:hypothetical protein